MNKKIKLYILYFSLIGVAILSSCSEKKSDAPAETKAKPEVQVANPIHQRMEDYLTFNGNTIFLNYEGIRATFAGYIEKEYRNIGDKVSAGEILYLIRTKESSALDSSSQIPVDMKFKGLVKIKAKTTGYIIDMYYHLGDYVMDGDQLAKLASPQSLRVSLNVPYKYMSQVRKTGNFTIILPDGRKYNAKLGNILPNVDRFTQAQAVILVIQNNEPLPDSLNVSVRIPGQIATNAIALPKSAIQTNETQSEFWVMRVVNGKMAIKVPIQKGIENPEYVQILEPALNLNDQFIIEGAYGLEDSTIVKIVGK